MLLDGHDLDGVVAVGGDAWEYAVTELGVGADAFGLLGHADVALVDEERPRVGGEVLDGPAEGGVLPYLGGEDVGLGVLDHSGGVGGDAEALTSGPVDAHFVELAVVDFVVGDVNFPYAVAQGVELEFGELFPVGKVADEVYLGGIGCPFAERPPVAYAVEAEVLVSVGEVFERVAVGGQVGFLADGVLMAPLDGCGVGLEPGVVLIDSESACFCRATRGGGGGFGCHSSI